MSIAAFLAMLCFAAAGALGLVVWSVQRQVSLHGDEWNWRDIWYVLVPSGVVLIGVVFYFVAFIVVARTQPWE